MRSALVVHVASETSAGNPLRHKGTGMQKFTEPRFIKPVSLGPEDRQRIAQRVRSLLASAEDIVFAYIYGSFARGEPMRDLDVALYTTEDKDFMFAIHVAALLHRVTDFEVHVIVMS